MDLIVFSLLVVLIVINAIIAWVFFGKHNKKQENSEGLSMVLQQMNELTRTVDSKIGESTKNMSETVRNQFQDSQRLIKEITQELTHVKETGARVESFVDQLQSLQDILKNPKQRGILGEYYLETLLKNVLPVGSYEMQYKLGQDDAGHDLVPDAIVRVKDKIIPIDSKFSLENYNRLVEEKNPAEKERLEKLFVSDLKNRITETAKYIQPSLGTMEFAFMFIPHEAIYYDLLLNKVGALKEETENLIQRAASKYRVIIVSPTSFLAYLQTVLQGLKALQIEEKAVDIIRRVNELGKHIGTYDQYMKALGKSLGTTVNHYNKADRELGKIDKDVLRIAGESAGVEVLDVPKPQVE